MLAKAAQELEANVDVAGWMSDCGRVIEMGYALKYMGDTNTIRLAGEGATSYTVFLSLSI